jgi:hypothetical protein
VATKRCVPEQNRGKQEAKGDRKTFRTDCAGCVENKIETFALHRNDRGLSAVSFEDGDIAKQGNGW